MSVYLFQLAWISVNKKIWLLKNIPRAKTEQNIFYVFDADRGGTFGILRRRNCFNFLFSPLQDIGMEIANFKK